MRPWIKIARLLLGCTLAATIATAQQAAAGGDTLPKLARAAGVMRSGSMLPGPVGPGGPAHAEVNQLGLNQLGLNQLGPNRQITGASIRGAAAAMSREATTNSGVGIIRSLSAPSGITYTCDPSINAVAGVCNTLNTTIAGLYANAFTNANANIYITFGATDLGVSLVPVYPVSYGALRNALQSSETDADDITAVNDSVPTANPINGNGQFIVKLANYRALGLTPPAGSGTQPDGTGCTLGTTGCYDGIITLSNTLEMAGNFYFRTGMIALNQYDFYTVVEHETDEILGVGSCAFGCSSPNPLPEDLFRYQSNGARSFAAGNNSSCSAATSGNACFSLDGVNMLQQFNNLANGDDAGDWLTNCSGQLVQNARECSGIAGVDISPAAEIRALDVIGYTRNGSAPGPLTVTAKLTSNTTGVVSGTCSTPPAVSNFTVASPAVYLYFSVTGANAGDTAQMEFIRPDAVVYTTFKSSPLPSSGSFCFSRFIDISGTSAASFLGVWSIQVFWDQSNTPLFTLNFTVSASSVTVTTKLTSNTTGIVNGVCSAPPAVSNFTVASPAVYLYFSVTGANAGDTAQVNFIRPDGMVYRTLNSAPLASSGSYCFSFFIDINGTQAASLPGTWTIQVFWDQSIAPLFTLNFNLSASIQGFSATQFVPVTPCRIADTRNANGPFGGPAIAGGASRDFVIPSSACGIPSTAAAYSMNVAVVPRGTLGYLTLWPSGQSQPVVATLNSIDGRVKSNAAIVPAGASGAVSVFATDTTDVILDINGFFVAGSNPAALAFYPLTPCRIADTRNAAGPLGGPNLAALSTRSFPVQASSCGLPASAQAYSLNFAAVPKGPTLGFLTAWPAGQSKPLVASLNDPTGTVLSNAVVVPAGAGGAVDVFATDATDLVIDVNGYFAPQGPGGLSLYTVTPCRVLDSRLPAGSPPFNTTRDVNVTASPCGVPGTAHAFVFNATVVPPGFLGYITMWPQGQTQPLAATLNAYDGAVTNNMAIVPTTTGSISVFPSNPTQLVLDVFGYFGP